MLEKSKTKKKRKRHKSSIVQKKDGRCYLCMKLENNYRIQFTQEHHIYDGPNRRISEAEGLKVHLCPAHHIEGPEAVHNNIKHMRMLQREGQRVYEQTHSREQFIRLFGRNYLPEEER